MDDLPKIPTAKLLEDAEILGESIWQIHPGIFKYNDSASFYNNLDMLRGSFQTDRTYREASKEISRFVGTLKCSHTYANFFNQIGLIKEIILEQPDKLPFGLTWIDRRMIITKNGSQNQDLITGTEILSVNGFTSSQIADSLLILTKGDGNRNEKRFNSLEESGYDYYEPFDVYFPLFFP